MIISTRSKPGIDAGASVDWGRTSADYARHRPGPPAVFYDRLSEHGIGLPGQRLLDLGTGTGVLALELARRGCQVTGTDISRGQIKQAQSLADAEDLNASFIAAPADANIFKSDSFEAVTALQCWWYFDHAATIAALQHSVVTGGLLAICGFSFLPREDPIVAASEALVLKYNPNWTGADWDGVTPVMPQTLPDNLKQVGTFVFDADIPFTAQGWRGRMRALRGIGAALPEENVAAFDAEHHHVLSRLTDGSFTIRHRIDAQIFRLGS